jgi:hypothetical protein
MEREYDCRRATGDAELIEDVVQVALDRLVADD